MSEIVIEQNVTLEQVRATKPKMIWYGAVTCWWTHDPNDLKAATKLSGRPDRSGGLGPLPTDPRGGVLMEAHDPEKFLRLAEESPEHYGKHGLAAFMGAHHQNCFLVEVIRGTSMIVRDSDRPWCLETWQEYNDAIDAALRGEGGET